MMLRFFRRGAARERLIETLRSRIDNASRAPGLFTIHGVPDTVEGRFELVCLHVILVLRRLRQLPPPADDVAQDLVDAVFAQFDAALREIGIGDMGVPKRMKKLAGAFYARMAGYDSALDTGDESALAAVLARNLFEVDEPERARSLAGYARASEAALSLALLDDLLTTGPEFPVPSITQTSDGRFA